MLRLADVLHDWGLTETASVVSRAKARLKALNAFQRLVAEPRSLEMQMHQALEGNVWVFGDEHELLKSNVTLQSVVKRLTDRVYSGGRGQKRPDLLLVGSMGRYLLVELKRPSHTVVHQDVAQRRDIATNRAYIGNQDQRIELAIIGGRVDTVLPRSLAADQWADSFDGLVVKASARLEWILENLSPEAEDLA